MLIEETIASWITEKFTEESFRDCFLVEVAYTGRQLIVYLDSDIKLDLDKCAVISRWLAHRIEEANLIEDAYTLEVSSSGLDRPLKLHRQYLKNIGRMVTVHTVSGSIIEGQLTGVNGDLITVTYEVIEKENKKKVKKTMEVVIHRSDILKTFIQIKF